MMKIFQTQIWQFVSLSNVSDVKTFYDPRDHENMVKVQLMTWNKMSTDNASWVQVSSLYLKW